MSEFGQCLNEYEYESPVSTMEWHPLRNLLFVSWSDGHFRFLGQDNELKMDTESQVASACWSIDGMYLFTAHVDKCSIWHVDTELALHLDWQVDETVGFAQFVSLKDPETLYVQ